MYIIWHNNGAISGEDSGLNENGNVKKDVNKDE